jgi:chemotaxis protein methyltransferase CheR
MTPNSSDHLESLIAERTGLKLRLHQRESLNKVADHRWMALALNNRSQYVELLKSDLGDAKAEWDQILGILTNNETYFYRDRGQIELLRQTILPEIIARNEPARTLRVWSAGCSTGEEAYSLAILVDELLPKIVRSEGRGWQISILGTDIDEPSLLQARHGVYGEWSFRSMDQETKLRCFTRNADGWKISEEYKSLVTFQASNLVGDQFPNRLTEMYDMDLILCRNVFIYFEPASVHSVVDKFAQTLREGGYLMTGHVESVGSQFANLEVRSYPESDVYRRVDLETKLAVKPKSVKVFAQTPSQTLVGKPTKKSVSAVSHPAEAVTSPQDSNPTPSEGAKDLVASPTQHASEPSGPSSSQTEDEALLQAARTLADLGRYSEAIECCERVIQKQPFIFDSYVILAAIAQERGQAEEAKRQLKKAIYLCPAVPHLYLEIGALYRSEGDTARASKMEDTALELLQQIPPETVVGSSDGPNAKQWIEHFDRISQEGS